MRQARWIVRGGWLAGAAAFGCGKASDAPAVDRPAPTMSIPAPGSVATTPAATPAAASAGSAFADAVVEGSPDDQLPPPDTTRAGKSTGQLRVAVQKAYDAVRFTSPAGKKVDYTVTIATAHGPVVLLMRPDLAPNHARHFVALCQVGYYDGLLFDSVLQQQAETPDATGVELVEAGSPDGAAEAGAGHLGYWLKPEFSEAAKHEPGIVGMCRDDEPDSAGVRFYIALSKAPVMDGQFSVFAQVVSGLDAVRTIAKQPRTQLPTQPDVPCLIQGVTVEAREAK